MSPLAQGDAQMLPLEGRRSAATNAERIPEEYLQLLLPDAAVHSWQQQDVHVLSQHLLVGKFSVWIHDITCYRNQVINFSIPHSMFALHYLFEHSLSIRMPRSGTFQLEEDTCNLFRLAPGHGHLPIQGGTKALALHINVLPGHMQQLAQKHPDMQQRVHAITNTNRVVNKHAYTINTISQMLITRILTCQFEGEVAALFLERCCQDLFDIFCRQYAIENKSIFPNDTDENDVYHQMLEYLKTHTHMYHDIYRLSWMYEIAVSELTVGFMNTFAISLEDCIHMLKMMQAFELLMQQEYNYSEIAATVALETDTMIAQVEEYYRFKLEIRPD